MDYKFYPPAKNFLKKTKDKNLLKEFQNAIDKILKDPLVGESKKGDLAGIYCYDVFYNKTNYEIAYWVKNDIVFVMIGPRENFYKTLKKYL